MSGTIEIAFGVILASLTGAVGWLLVTVITNARDVAVLATRLNEADVRDEVSEVHRRVDDIGRNVSDVSGQLKQINRTLGLIQEHLMSGRADG